MISYIFNGDTYYSENDVNKAIVDYIYKTESVGDIDVEETIRRQRRLKRKMTLM